MMMYDMVDEGIEIIANVRKRYDGEKANPFDETEYGRHYARPMAIWAAIPALSGFHYDARLGRMQILPKVTDGRFQCFWSTPAAWGGLTYASGALTLTPVVGTVKIRELLVGPAFRHSEAKLSVMSADEEIANTRTLERQRSALFGFRPLSR